METRTLVRIALMAALIGALGFVPPIFLPIAAGVPVSAQTLGVMLAGLLLGARGGAAACALFALVVLLGAPLLSGGRGGLGVLAGPTVGFFLGFIPGAFVTGLLAERLRLGGLVSAGYFLGNLEWARQNFSLIVYGIIIVSVLPVVIEVARSKFGKGKD